MLLPFTGPIGLNDLRLFLATEVGDSSALTSSLSLNSSVARYSAGKHSGTISIEDLRDKYAGEIRAPSFSPAPLSIYTANVASVGSNGGLSVSLSRAGKLTIRSNTYNGTTVTAHINNVQMPGFYGADVIQKNCRVTITRNSWNGVGGSFNGYTYTPALGWETAGFSLSFLGNAVAEASYTLSVQDLLNPANNISFTTTLRLTP